MKTALTICAVLLVLSAVPAGGEEDAASDKPETSMSVAYGTYGATQGRVSAVVSAYAASFDRSEKHFALQVAVGVGGKGPEITFKQDSFWLVDAQGISHQMSAPQELANETSLIDFTDDLESRFPIQLTRTFDFYRRVQSDFYGGDGLRWSNTNLDQDSFFEDTLFFIQPVGGLDGVLTLQVAGEGMEDTLEVKFEVPADKKQYKKSHKKNTKKKKKSEASS